MTRGGKSVEKDFSNFVHATHQVRQRGELYSINTYFKKQKNLIQTQAGNAGMYTA